MTSFQGPLRRWIRSRLCANHAAFRAGSLDGQGGARDQSAATDGNEEVERTFNLTEKLQA